MAGIGRFQHTGAAPQTTLASSMLATDTSFTAASGTGYPDGSVGDFVVAIDVGLSSEEKILCSARTGAVFTVAGGVSGRGYDNTSAASHMAPSATVEHVVAATEIDDASRHINPTGGSPSDDHLNYPLLTGSRAFTGATTAPAYAATLSGNGRYVGTTTGAPGSGTFIAGDFANDPTNDTIWQCTTGGSPGTWEGGTIAGRMYASSTVQTVNSASSATVTLAQDFVSGGVTTGSNAIVVPLAGTYLVNFHVTWSDTTGNFAVTAAGEYDALAVKNGSTNIASSSAYSAANGSFVSNQCSNLVVLAASDSITLLAKNQTASNEGVQGSASAKYLTWLSVVRLGP